MTEIHEIPDKCLDAANANAHRAFGFLLEEYGWEKAGHMCDTYQIKIRQPLEAEGCLYPGSIPKDLEPLLASFSIAEIHTEAARRFRVKDEMAATYRKDLVLVK